MNGSLNGLRYLRGKNDFWFHGTPLDNSLLETAIFRGMKTGLSEEFLVLEEGNKVGSADEMLDISLV